MLDKIVVLVTREPNIQTAHGTPNIDLYVHFLIQNHFLLLYKPPRYCRGRIFCVAEIDAFNFKFNFFDIARILATRVNDTDSLKVDSSKFQIGQAV